MLYSQLSLCGHLAITDTPLLRTGAEVRGIITENITRCHGLSLLRTSNLGPGSVRYSETVHCLATLS